VGLDRREVALEPLACQPRHLVERTGLLEEVRRSGDDHQLLLAAELLERRPVQLDHLKVVAADDQQRRRPDERQGRPGEIGAPTARDDRADRLGAPRRRDQRGGGAGAGAEVADPKMSRLRMLGEPVGGPDESLGEQADVEAQVRRRSTASSSAVSRSTRSVASFALLSSRAT
jgi:hypothetical protein